MMTQLYPTAAAKSTRTARRFGQGVLATSPVYRAEFTVSDAAWLLQDEIAREEQAREREEILAGLARLDREADLARYHELADAGFASL